MKIQSRINLLRYSRSADVSGGALSHAVVKIAIPSQKMTTLRAVPKTIKTPLSRPQNRRNERMGELALANRP